MQIEQETSHLVQSPPLSQYLVEGQDATNLLIIY